MIRIFFIILAILAATNNVTAFVEQVTKASVIDLLIKSIDKNNDGKLTEEEVSVNIQIQGVPIESIIRKLDNDDDKAVDRKDLEINAKRWVSVYLGMADFDSNGYATEKEINSFMCSSLTCKSHIKGMVQFLTFLFDLADLNGDGTLSDADYPTVSLFKQEDKEKNQLPERALLLRETIDANKDYQLSKTEVTHFITTALNKIDKDNDGIVTLQEIFETMKEFKFPETLINRIKQKYSNPKMAQFTDNVRKVIFKEVDINKDAQINADELSALLTKPISSTFVNSMMDAYTNLPMSVPTITRPQNMNDMENEREAIVSAISSFLKASEFDCCSASSLNTSISSASSLNTCILSFFLVLVVHVLNN